VKIAQANEIIRLERLEQRLTLRLTEEDVVREYQKMSGARSPGDGNDTGLVMLNNNRQWRKVGFSYGGKQFKICAFGELDPHDGEMLRAGVYLLHGVQFGFSLPRACQNMTNVWDVPAGAKGADWQPGSWGGHAVFSKKYDTGGMQVLTWGQKVYVTNEFIARYCDEAWAVVDDFDNWRKRPEIDIEAIKAHLREIGASGIEQ
jgi:hypothetical protein